MKISERVALIKAGYNREEIAAMIEEERAQPSAQTHSPVIESTPPTPDEEVTDPAPVPTIAPMFPDWASSLIASVYSLRETIQASNLHGIEQPETATAADVAADALMSVYGGG